jgi:hypothetical protein
MSEACLFSFAPLFRIQPEAGRSVHFGGQILFYAKEQCPFPNLIFQLHPFIRWQVCQVGNCFRAGLHHFFASMIVQSDGLKAKRQLNSRR